MFGRRAQTDHRGTRRTFLRQHRRNLFLAKELIKLLHLLESHAIPAIAYKGPTLAVSICGTSHSESSAIWTSWCTSDFRAARRLLISRGFRLTIEHEWEEEFRDSSGKVAVDLHRRIASRDFPSPLNFDYLLKRLRPVDLAGTTAATLCPEDTLLMLGCRSRRIAIFSYPRSATLPSFSVCINS